MVVKLNWLYLVLCGRLVKIFFWEESLLCSSKYSDINLCNTKKPTSYCSVVFCIILLQVAKCFVPVQILWVSPKFWLYLVLFQKLLCRHKKQFYWMQIIFLSGTKCLWLAQYVNKSLVRHKKFGPAQNILRPVKGQGISKNHLHVLCPK